MPFAIFKWKYRLSIIIRLLNAKNCHIQLCAT